MLCFVYQSRRLLIHVATRRVSMLEATAAGCFPLCPNQLVYPELYPAEFLYNTPQQLKKTLAAFAARPALVRAADPRLKIPLERFDEATLRCVRAASVNAATATTLTERTIHARPLFEEVLLGATPLRTGGLPPPPPFNPRGMEQWQARCTKNGPPPSKKSKSEPL